MKKAVRLSLFVLMVLWMYVGASTAVYAEEALESQLSYVDEAYIVITDPNELQRLIDDEVVETPLGYTLEKVEISVYNLEEIQEASDLEQGELTEPYSTTYSIKNIKDEGDGIYYTSEYDADWYYGPATISTTYSRTDTVKKSLSVTISASVLKAAVGYDVTQSYTSTKSFSTQVASGKALHVKIYTNYKKTSFDIYKNSTRTYVEYGAYTMKPVGLIIMQTTYAVA